MGTKPYVFLLIFLGLFISGSFAVEIGGAVGLNFASLNSVDETGEDDSDGDGKTGFHVGAVADFPINDMFAVSSGLGYTIRGDAAEEAGVEVDISFSYLTIPILAVVKFPAGAVTPYLAIGPEIGFTLAAETEISGTGGLFDGTTDIKDQTNGLTYGLQLGAGAAMPLGSINPFVQVSYYLGLANDYKDPVGDAKSTHSGIHLNLGAKFGL